MEQEPKRSKKSPEQKAKELLIEQRRVKVAELKLKARSVRAIAQELGVGVATVQRDIEAVFARTREFANASIRAERAISLARLEVATEAIMPALEAGGRGLPEDENGAAIDPFDSTLDAVDRLVKLDTRRAKLLGLEAPQAMVVTAVDQGIAHILNVAQRVLPAEHFERLASAIAAESSESEAGESEEQRVH
jgi:hypothetical protein